MIAFENHSKGPQEVFYKIFLDSLVVSKTEEKSKVDVFLLKALTNFLQKQVESFKIPQNKTLMQKT